MDATCTVDVIPAQVAVMEHDLTSNTFRASCEEISPVLVLHVAGEIDFMTAPCLKQHVDQLIGRGLPIIVDCSVLRYLDMAGIHVLEDCHQRAEQAGQRLFLVGSAPLVHKIFAITQLNQRIPLFDTMGEALKAVGQEEMDVA